MDEKLSFVLNGTPQSLTTDPTRPLLEVLREDLHIHGVKFGCGEAQCGACSVLVDGKRVFSCMAAVKSVAGKTVTTLEGLAAGDGGGTLHPVQQAFLDEAAYQCGFCTAGMIMAAVVLLKDKPHPSDAEIVAAMDHNLCRCCTYPRIINAVRRAADSMGR